VTSQLLPREHGAYGQVSLPLATALVLTGVNRVSVAFSIAVVAAFLAHEPLQVLFGGRGSRANRELGARAQWWAGVLSGVSLASGVAAVTAMDPSIRWTVAFPLVPAAYVFASAARRREKATPPEVSAAVAFSLAVVPICLQAGHGWAVATLVALSYAVAFTVMTLAVRAFILETRAGGNARAATRARHAVGWLGAVSMAASLAAAAWGAWPPMAPLALAPGILVAVGIVLWPPRADRLRTVGWTLVAASVATMVALVGLLA